MPVRLWRRENMTTPEKPITTTRIIFGNGSEQQQTVLGIRAENTVQPEPRFPGVDSAWVFNHRTQTYEPRDPKILGDGQ